MDIKQLRYFHTVVQEGQFTRAAKKLHMAQPPLSQQIKLLEQELDVLLLERNGRNIEPTPAGKLLFKKANELILQLDETAREVKEMGEGLKGNLSIGTVITCFSYLPERIRLFRDSFPLVTFQLREGDSYRLKEQLTNREIELAIAHPPFDANTFDIIPLPKEPFVLVTPKSWNIHPVNENAIQLKELSTLPLLLMRRLNGSGLDEMIIDQCRSGGIEPNVFGVCPDAALLLWLVSSGVAATILPKSTLSSLPTTDLKIFDIENFNIHSDSAVIWLKDRYLSKCAVRFIDTFRKGLK
ncbi:DNA-binding transcriptional LysR family regulator [Scopulibacillus darangshiensis]|uniref:DNA-binding transcriptional LysR family regulator n=1 Tax=Scopulibacillus darangshiensis TaxID=442528 RepID=A0A4R2P7I2_9BACL|nr:LysR family transcriptional regulator [Scopulibacillus darangshiensis]TCP30852.1 DNA-binding transcriptional LysR family regulator [Scopulibacillus darangshiensis]